MAFIERYSRNQLYILNYFHVLNWVLLLPGVNEASWLLNCVMQNMNSQYKRTSGFTKLGKKRDREKKMWLYLLKKKMFATACVIYV